MKVSIGTHNPVSIWVERSGKRMIYCKGCGFAKRGSNRREKEYVLGELLSIDCNCNC